MQPSNPYLDYYRSSANFGAAPQARQAGPAAAPHGPSGLKGFLINNAPAIGGVLGGIAGEGVDIFGGGIAGAAIGSSLGEQVKQNMLGEAKGNIGEQLKQDAIQGAEGGAGGALGKGLGLAKGAGSAIVSKTLPKLAGQAGEQVAVGDGAAQGGSFVSRLLNKAATNQAQNQYTEKVGQEFGLPGTKGMSDNGTPINAVLAQMQKHGIEPGVTQMGKYGNVGFSYNDVLEGLTPKGTPVQLNLGDIIDNAVKSQPSLGALGTKNLNSLKSTLRTSVLAALDPNSENIGSLYHPNDLLAAAQRIYNFAPANKAEGQAFESVRKGLVDAAGKQGGVNDLIKGFKLPSVKEAFVNGSPIDSPEARMVGDILKRTEGNTPLAQEVVDNINKAGSIQDLQKAELQHIAANDIAQSAAKAHGTTLDKVAPAEGGFSAVGSPSGAYYATRELIGAAHNPLMALPLVAARGAGGMLGKLAGRFGEADMSQVGPRAIPELGMGAEAGGAVAPEVAQGAEQAAAPQAAKPSNLFGVPSMTRPQEPGIAGQLPTVAKGVQAAGTAVSQGANFAKALPGAAVYSAMHPVGTAGRLLQQAGSRGVGNLAMNGLPTGGGDQNNPNAPGATDMGTLSAEAGQVGQQQGPENQPRQYPLQSMLSDIQRDPKNASTYETLYKDLQAAEAPPKPTTAQSNTIEGLQTALGSLQPYAEQLQGSQSPGSLGGKLESVIGGLPGAPANLANIHALDNSRTEIATQIAKALTGSKPAASVIKSWESNIPSVTDTPAVRQAKWEQLAQRLQGELEQAQQPVTNPTGAYQVLSQLGAYQ